MTPSTTGNTLAKLPVLMEVNNIQLLFLQKVAKNLCPGVLQQAQLQKTFIVLYHTLYFSVQFRSQYFLFIFLAFLYAVTPDDFTVSIMADDVASIAGQIYSLTCVVTTADGLLHSPSLEWLDSSGHRVTTVENIIITAPVTSGLMTNFTLQFSPLRLSHDGEFTCRTIITTPALPGRLMKSAEWDIIVDSKFPFVCVAEDCRSSTVG